MGTGIGLKCPKCSFHEKYYLGTGMLLPVTYTEVVDGIRNGEYGSEWQDYFKKHRGAAVDVDREVYHCPQCNAIVEDYNLDLYCTINGSPFSDSYFDPEGSHPGFKLIKHHPHPCPKCGGQMERADRNDQKSLPCPECGTTLIFSDDCIWD